MTIPTLDDLTVVPPAEQYDWNSLQPKAEPDEVKAARNKGYLMGAVWAAGLGVSILIAVLINVFVGSNSESVLTAACVGIFGWVVPFGLAILEAHKASVATRYSSKIETRVKHAARSLVRPSMTWGSAVAFGVTGFCCVVASLCICVGLVFAVCASVAFESMLGWIVAVGATGITGVALYHRYGRDAETHMARRFLLSHNSERIEQARKADQF